VADKPLSAEDEICNALKEVVQRVVDFDSRIILITIKASVERGQDMAVEVKVGRTQDH